jgi:hypothetical protein
MKTPTFNITVRLSFVLLMVTGCSREEESARTVSWFQQHPNEREATVARCTDNPGQLGQTPNCINAKQAEALERIGSLRKLPPLDLPLPPKREDSRDDDRAKVRP